LIQVKIGDSLTLINPDQFNPVFAVGCKICPEG